MAGPHRNPNAKPTPKPQPGGRHHRENPKANDDARGYIPKKIKDNVVINGGGKSPTDSSNKPVSVPNAPKHKQGVTPSYPKISSKETGKPYQYNYNYSSQDNKHRVEENYYMRKKREEEEDKYWRTHTLEGRVQSEIDSVTQTNQNTAYYDTMSALVNNTMANYMYFESDEDAQKFKEWYEKWTYTEKRFDIDTGKDEEIIMYKKDAPPPPVGVSEDGDSVDYDDFKKAWKFCQLYDKKITEYTEEQRKKAENGELTKYAGQDDSADSWLDVFRAAVNPDESGKKAFKNYVKGYIWNPLVNGDYKALAINTLWNMGETMDFLGVGVRSAVAGKDVVGGSMKRDIEGQNVWWYGQSKSEHQTQKELMQLGAEKLLKGGLNEHKDESREAIEARIKEAGLWDEYEKMSAAYTEHFSDHHTAKQILNNVKSAYTDTSANFHADTGNVLSDIGIELALDPTLVIGGLAKGVASGGVKAIGKGAVTKTIQEFGIKGVNAESQRVIDQAINRFVRNNGELLLSKNTDKIDDEIKQLGEIIREHRDPEKGLTIRNVKDPGTEFYSTRNFEQALSKEIKANIDTANYRVIRSFHAVDSVMDKVDSTLLKTVFAGPYIPIKSGLLANRGIRSMLYKARQTDGFIGDTVARLQYGKAASIGRKAPKTIDMSGIEKEYAKIKQEPYEMWDDLDKYVNDTKIVSQAINKHLSDLRNGKITVGEYRAKVDESLQKHYPNRGLSRDQFKQYLDTLYRNAPENDRGRIGEYVSNLKTELEQIEEVEKRLVAREEKITIKELKKIETHAGLSRTITKFVTNTGEYRFSDELSELVQKKLDYLDGKISEGEVDMSIRNYERKTNTSVGRNTNDANINIPKEVSENGKFTIKDTEAVKPEIEELIKFVDGEGAQLLGLNPLRNYFSKIGDVKNIDPNDLQKAIYASIGSLTIRRGLGEDISNDVFKRLKDLDNNLRKEIEYKTITSDEELVALKLDNLTTFESMVSHPKMKKIMETLRDENSVIGKALNKFRVMQLASKEFEDNPVFSALQTIENFLTVNNHFETFKNELHAIDGLSDRQYFQVIDRLFGITKGSPKDFLNNAYRNPEKFMEDLETLLVAEYGQVKCNLDGARAQIKTLNEDLFKQYKAELDDPKIVERLSKLTESGHIDPMNDVRVQMLYTILRDPSIIDDYNDIVSKGQKVIFSDIETTGLNFNRDSITSIAFKEWKHIDTNDLSLEKLLDVIEDTDSEKSIRRSLSTKELDRIDDSLLNSIFKHDPKLANTDRYTKLQAYKEYYAQKANGVDIFDTDEGFMRGLNQYLTDSSIVKKKRLNGREEIIPTKVPCLVFHNTNGFDSKFIANKMVQLDVGIPGGAYKHLSDLEDNMHNTLARLRELEKDVILTYEEKVQVKQAVIDFAKNISRYSDSFKLLDPRSLEIAFQRLQRSINPETKAVKTKEQIQNAEDVLAEAENNLRSVKPEDVDIDKYQKNGLQTKLGTPNSDRLSDYLLEGFQKNEMLQLRKDLTEVCGDVRDLRTNYERNLFTSPYGNMADEFTYSNIMRSSMEVNQDYPWSALSYNKVFSGTASKRFFNWYSSEKIPVHVYDSMKQFTDWIDDKVQRDLLRGADEIIEEYEDVYRLLIDSMRTYAQNISKYNDFAYLRYLRQPATPMEAYLMSQKLWDDIIRFIPEDFELGAMTNVEKGFRDMYLKGEPVPEQFIQLQRIIAGMGEKSEQTLRQLQGLQGKDNYAFSILAGDKHTLIFRSADGTSADYTRQLKTKTQQEYSKIQDAEIRLKRRSNSLDRKTPLLQSETMVVKNNSVKDSYKTATRIIERLEDVGDTPVFWDMFSYFKREVFKKRAELYDNYRLNRLTKKGIKQEEFLAEIVLSNGMRRIIPKVGNDIHIRQLEVLRENLKRFGDEYLDVVEDEEYIFIQTKTKPIIRTEVENGKKIKIATFPDSGLTLKAMPEQQLEWADFDEVMSDYISTVKEKAKDDSSIIYKDMYEKILRLIYKDIQKLYKDIDYLTDGASVGTLGIVTSRSKERKIIRSLDKKIYDRGLGADYTCDDYLWTEMSFEKSLLGDFDNSWKLGNNEDDFDILMNAINVLDEISSRSESITSYIDTWFGARSTCRIKDWAKDFTDDELFEMLNGSEDYVLVTLHDFKSSIAESETGYEVRQLKLKDKYSILQAKDRNAICVPYDTYLELANTINKTEITNTVLKHWTKYLALIKAGQIANIGTWTRNWIDATIRAAADEGSLITALGYEFIAAKRLTAFMKINKEVGADVTEVTWKAMNYDRYMTYKQYQELLGFRANKAVSGGESDRTKQILKYYEKEGKRNEALGIDEYRTLGNDIERFEQAFTEDEIDKYIFNMSFKDKNKYFSNMTEDRFREIYKAYKEEQFIELLDGEKYLYNEIAKKLIDMKGNSKIGENKVIQNKIDSFMGGILTPMSQIEQVVRFSQLLCLQDMGLSRAAAYRHIIDTQFNYNNKTLRMKCLEAVVPFATFQYNNVLYWARQLENNPRMLRYIEDTFGTLSFDNIEDVIDEENGIVNKSLEYQLASMGLPIGSGGLYFKLNPSMLDALNWYYVNPSDILNKIASPIRMSAQGVMELAGMDQWDIFKDVDFSYSAKDWILDCMGLIPFGDTAANYGIRHFIDSKPWTNVQDPLHKRLVKYLPMLFGAVKAYKDAPKQDFDDWQSSLEEQGMWYDANQDKIVDISEKNDKGLNNPDLSWNDRKILMWIRHGKLYDANQGKFVSLEYYKKGGLNRNWDFSSDAEKIDWYDPATKKHEKISQWDYYCKLKKRYFGLTYDLNQRKFVKPEQVIEGGLNSDDLDWDEICDLNEELGYYWDGNQGRFVEKKDLTEGGLNKEDLSFPELCAYQLAIHGKVWDQSKHEFIQVKEPSVVMQIDSDFSDWRVFNNLGFNPTMLDTDRVNYVDQTGSLRSISGKYVLTSNNDINQNVFRELLKNFSYPLGREYSYRDWSSKWYNVHPSPVVPSRPYQNNLQVKGKLYGKTNINSNRSAGLRMALTGMKTYDDYYKFEYNYNYSYRNPTGLYNIHRYDYKRQDRLISNKNSKLFMYPN